MFFLSFPGDSDTRQRLINIGLDNTCSSFTCARYCVQGQRYREVCISLDTVSKNRNCLSFLKEKRFYPDSKIVMKQESLEEQVLDQDSRNNSQEQYRQGDPQIQSGGRIRPPSGIAEFEDTLPQPLSSHQDGYLDHSTAVSQCSQNQVLDTRMWQNNSASS